MNPWLQVFDVSLRGQDILIIIIKKTDLRFAADYNGMYIRRWQ